VAGAAVSAAEPATNHPGWPLEALLDAIGASSIRSAADALGVDRRQLHRWRAAGGLSDAVADRCAISIGTHPALVWEGWA